MTKRNTKKALVLSLLSLLLCCSMLVGTTFAWFTDSVTSGRNTIVAGNLDVELYYKLDVKDAWQRVTAETEIFDDATLWEPGFTQVVYLKIANEGTLALQYQIGMNVLSETTALSVNGPEFRLSDYIMYGTKVVDDQANFVTSREEARNAVATTATTISNQYTNPVWDNGELEAEEVSYLTLVAYMPETVGNEANYRGTAPSIQLGLNLTATQFTYERDSFNDQYDADAALPQKGTGSASAPTAGQSAVEIIIRNPVTNAKVASAVIPAAAVASTATQVNVEVDPTETYGNITIGADEAAQSFDVKVTGLKENNDTPVKVQLRIEAGKDPATVKLYHYDVLIPSTYNPTTGYVSFESTTFSPFTVVYEAESEYDPPAVEESKLPKANVTEYTDTDNIVWGNYGQWSPTEGLEANLDAAYTFACTETADEAALNPYANWYCDFYVSLDKELGENQIFLGGNYGDFGWVGFHNGELTLEANTEIGLLESVTTNPWTYADVANFVGTFICGVGDVDGALAGATFTVCLRLTNPENPNEFYDVNTITYKFPIVINTAEELQNAFNNGGNYELGSDIDLNDLAGMFGN